MCRDGAGKGSEMCRDGAPEGQMCRDGAGVRANVP